MRNYKDGLFITMLILLISFSSCKEDIQDPLQTMPLEGQINGNDWEYNGGKALFDAFNQRYRIELYSFPVATQNPNDYCFEFGGNTAYIDFEVPLTESTINQPSGIYKSVTFHYENEQTEFTATQGYVEIILISNFEIRGIINCKVDDNNFMAGIFSVSICN